MMFLRLTERVLKPLNVNVYCEELDFRYNHELAIVEASRCTGSLLLRDKESSREVL